METKKVTVTNWENFFGDVSDPRCKNSFLRHKLHDILIISLCAFLSGADNDEEIATYGREKEEFLRTFLELPHGIPSHDTFTRVLRNLDPTSFFNCLKRQSEELLDFISTYHLAIDGKVMRGTDTKGNKKSGMCVISAWATEHKLMLGQCKTDAKSNEKTAIPELLESLDLQGAVVSIDAIANSPSNAKIIKEKEGDYILALKKNQKNTFNHVETMMHKYVLEGRLDTNKTHSFGSGRIETRTCYVNHDFDFMDEVLAWKGIKSVIMIHSKREINEVVQEEYRFYLSSVDKDAAYFNKEIRNHWGVETLHWHLDMSFDEDRCKTRKGNGAENHNILRKMALKALTLQDDKHSIKERRKKAGWNDKYLKELLKNMAY